MEPTGLPPQRAHDHHIPLQDNSNPVATKLYRYPYYQKIAIEKLVTELLNTGVIRPSNSPFSSSVVLVKKHDGSWRMCIDYRSLNKITIKDKFPIPVVDELLDELHGANNGVAVDSNKISAMLNWPQHTTPRAMRGFLGLTGYYRKFIQNYGAVLSQERPIAFHSQAFHGKNLSLSTYEKEMLALVIAVKKWQHYLLGRKFVVKTDQKSLQYLLSQKINTEAQQRWLYKLMGFDFSIEYKQGKENKVADALSRMHEESKEKMEVMAITCPTPHWVKAVKEDQESSEHVQQLVSKVKEGEAVGPWVLRDGLFFFKDRIYVAPESTLQQDIIAQFHDSSHEGFLKTFHRIRANFYWQGMRDSIKTFIRECSRLHFYECVLVGIISLERNKLQLQFSISSPDRWPNRGGESHVRDVSSVLHKCQSQTMGTAKVAVVEQELLQRDQVLQELKQHIKTSQNRMKQVLRFHYGKILNLLHATMVHLRSYGALVQLLISLTYQQNLKFTLCSMFHCLRKNWASIRHHNHNSLLFLEANGEVAVRPQAILDQRRRRNQQEVLVHWQGLSPADATWENLEFLRKQFPGYVLEDKDHAKEGGVVTVIRGA
uniref:Chromo domain-containing protein n=1 Tax=Fagus sylvatica TaxID=28930 RepID=A0A2N9HL73_FAGSY